MRFWVAKYEACGRTATVDIFQANPCTAAEAFSTGSAFAERGGRWRAQRRHPGDT